MSRLWGMSAPDSPTSVSWTERIICDRCSLTIRDKSRNIDGDVGASFSRLSWEREHQDRSTYLIDFCEGCAPVVHDVLLALLKRFPVSREVVVKACSTCLGAQFIKVSSRGSLIKCAACDGSGVDSRDLAAEEL
jgi:hypothetical protein